MSGERLVLKSKATGKIASRSDQSKKAIVLKAFELAKECQNMGVPSLLAPKSTKEKAEIAAIGDKYDVFIVKTRSGEKSGASDKKRLLEASKNDNLFAKLAVHSNLPLNMVTVRVNSMENHSSRLDNSE